MALSSGNIAETARSVAGPVIEDMGYELVDVRFVVESGRRYLRFFIDKPGGVGLDDCQAVSREIGAVIDVEDFIPGPYSLEVSSPGLDRPLFGPADFARFTGFLAKVKTKELIGGRKVFRGRITGAADESFGITAEDGVEVSIDYDQVERANLEVEF